MNQVSGVNECSSRRDIPCLSAVKCSGCMGQSVEESDRLALGLTIKKKATPSTLGTRDLSHHRSSTTLSVNKRLLRGNTAASATSRGAMVLTLLHEALAGAKKLFLGEEI